jgi:hypothetical protein
MSPGTQLAPHSKASVDVSLPPSKISESDGSAKLELTVEFGTFLPREKNQNFKHMTRR